MSRLALVTLLVFTVAGLIQAGTITTDLIQKVNSSGDDDLIRIIVTMEAQADFQELITSTVGLTKYETRHLVITYLQDMALTSQKEAKTYLESFEPSGRVKNLQSVSIVNILHCMATPDVIRGMEGFPGIKWVRHDPERYMLFREHPEKASSSQIDATDEIAWGVNDINAPDVWAIGYDGTGVIVGVIDTGVNYNHNDLLDHMWNGGPQYPHHGWDFHNNDNNPMDGSFGHGTHCAGSVASDGTAGSQCGVAPNATIMAIKVLSDYGSGSEGPVISGINFAVNQGADIFSMSLGWQSTSQKYEFRTACNNALAAGVIGAIAAGNEGNSQWSYPIPGNVRTPGDVPPPWLNPDQTLMGGLSCVVTVGATDINHNIAGFSSRGPVTWESVNPWNDYAYSGGSLMGLIDPDVSAPGVNVKSLNSSNIWGYSDGWDGTSMATPHVAGTMALMLHKDPSLTPAQLDMYLETTALDWGSAGKDNTFGAGRIDAFAAVSAISTTPSNVTIDLTYLSGSPVPAGGGYLGLDIRIENLEPNPVYFDLWIAVEYEGGQPTTLAQRSLTFPAGHIIYRPDMLWPIPAAWAAGDYEFWGRVGNEPVQVWDESGFPFTKSGIYDGSDFNSWMVTGLSNPLDQIDFGTWDDGYLTMEIPESFYFGQNYPNPFNPVTTIPFSIPKSGYVSLKVYDLNGREAASILEGELAAGRYDVVFDASTLTSGIYIYRLNTSDHTATGKMIFMK